jgi:hypothetical protein
MLRKPVHLREPQEPTHKKMPNLPGHPGATETEELQGVASDYCPLS